MPSVTSVKDSVTELSVTPATARSATVPGFVTGAVTLIAAVPLWPSLVAVIIALPATTPVTSPLPLTLATAGLLVDQAVARPERTFPAESSVIAVSGAAAPTSMLTVAGVTVTEATGAGVTVTVAVSETPPGFPFATTLTLPVSEPGL